MTQTKTIYKIKLIWNNLFDIRVTGFSSNWRSQTYEILTVLFSELMKLIYYVKMFLISRSEKGFIYDELENRGLIHVAFDPGWNW